MRCCCVRSEADVLSRVSKGVRLDRYSGRLCGTMTEMADPVFGRQKEVCVVAPSSRSAMECARSVMSTALNWWC